MHGCLYFNDCDIGGFMNLAIYLISFILFNVSFLCLKKSKEKLSFVRWLGISLISYMAIIAFVAGIFGLIGFPIMCMTICPIIMLISCFFLYKINKEGKQTLLFRKGDICFLILLVIATVLFWIVYFHFGLPLRFVSVDASVHCRWARSLALTHKIDSNLYFGYLNDGLVMEALMPFTGNNGFYHSFTLMRIFDFFLAGLLFYGIVCNIPKGKYQHIITYFLTFTYLVGYPLYAIMFGFVYFGEGVTVISWVILNCILYKDKLIDKRIILILLNLSLFSIFTTYTLFVPSIFVGVFIYIFCVMIKNGFKIFSKETIKEEFKIFLIPCILGMAYAYVNLKEATSGGGISNDGGKYFDLYSNFVFLIPFALSYSYKKFKNKETDVIGVLFIAVTLFTLLLFGLSWNGYVSTYYLSKMYNIIWLLCFVMLIQEIVSLSEKEKALVNGMAIVFAVLCGFVIIDADGAFYERGYIRQSAVGFTDIFYFNGNYILGTPIMDDTQIDFYNKAEGIVSNNDVDSMLYVGEEISANWFKAFTNQVEIETSDNADVIKERIVNSDCQYIAVSYGYYDDLKDMFDSFGEIEYTNEFGVIIKTKQ